MPRQCATCGGNARRVTWGSTDVKCFRCGSCHAGGHIAADGDREVERGGVFSELNNYATRQVEVTRA